MAIIIPIVMRMAMTDKSPTLDWHSARLDCATRIDAAYRNTQYVRRFFKAEIGDRFRIDRAFMLWMKTHQGASLADAVAERLRREAGR